MRSRPLPECTCKLTMNPSSPESAGNDTERPSDGDLLKRFARDGDESAFAEIVRRYHGLVMSVCQRITGCRSDAEDAFQSVFLVLARRPRSVRHSRALCSWLYTVAVRTSWRVVKRRNRQTMEPLNHEPAVEPPGPLERIESTQNLLILDEELQRLPDRYRDVLVMTCFGSLTSQQVADELCVSRGTVDGRLKRARAMLRVRLMRRGVTLTVLGAAVSKAAEAAAAVSPELLTAVMKPERTVGPDSATDAATRTRLESLVKAETAMISTRVVAAGLAGLVVAAGAAGLFGLKTLAAQNGAAQNGAGQSGAGPDGAAVLDGRLVDPSTADGPATATTFVGMNERASDEEQAAIRQEQLRQRRQLYEEFLQTHRVTLCPGDASPTERWLYEQLERPVPPLDYPGEVSLGEILDTLAEYFSTTGSGDQKFRMQIWPDTLVLAGEGIDSLEEVTVQDIVLDGQPLRIALKLIFERTDPNLDYVIRDQMMHITTAEVAHSDDYLTVRTYPIGHLLDVGPSGIGQLESGNQSIGTGSGVFQIHDPGASFDSDTFLSPDSQSTSGAERAVAKQELIGLITGFTSPPCRWVDDDGEGGTIAAFGDSLVILQTPAGHEAIIELLNALTEVVARTEYLQ